MYRVTLLLGLLLGGAAASPLIGREELTTLFTCPGDGNYAIPGQCSGNFFICVSGVAYIATCPGNGIFDSAAGKCVANGTAACQEPLTPPTSTTPFVTTVTSRTTTTVPFDCPGNGFYAIPGQCTADYYICMNGTAYIQICTDTTIFDPETLVCTSPETASCFASTTTTSNTTTSSITSSTSTTGTPFFCPGSGEFPVPGQCTADYYICVDGVAYPTSCPGDLIFDPETLKCASPDTVSCRATATASTSTTNAPTTIGTTPQPFRCPGDGNFPVPGQCTANYYICVDGIAYSATCPGVTIFDPATLICSSPDTVSCFASTTTMETTSTTTTSPASNTTSPSTTGTSLAPFVCPSDGNFAVPGQCSANYFTCVDGVAYMQTCPEDSLFDPEVLLCLSPNVVSCRVGTTGWTTPTPITTDRTTTMAPFNCPSDGYYPIAGQCTNQYYICFNGEAFLQECPGTSLFDPETLRCESVDSVSCRATTPLSSSSTTRSTTAITTPVDNFTTTTMSSNTTERTTSAPFTCLQDGNFPIPGRCSNQFYMCVDGVAYLSNCPGTSVFDPELLICVAAENASCAISTTSASTETSSALTETTTQNCTTERSTTQVSTERTSTPSGSTTPGLFLCPALDGYFPIPGQCSSSYYICIDGVAYPTNCPGSAIFDPNTLTCVSPDIASCKSSSTISASSTTNTPTTTMEPSTSMTSFPTTSNSATTSQSTTVRTTTGSTPPRPFVCPSPNGLFPNPDPSKCNTYYSCDNNHAVLMYCNPPLVFNAQAGYCDWQFNVPDCKVNISEPSTSEYFSRVLHTFY